MASDDKSGASVIVCGLARHESTGTPFVVTRCPYDGWDLVFGYGMAAGGIGSYDACNKCGRLYNFSADESGETDEHFRDA